mgnify:FL=1
MADENGTTVVDETKPNGEGAPAPTDWEAKYNELKKHSREWERKAKANKDAADELAALKESQMSETDRLKQQLTEMTAKADGLQAERDRAAWVADAARATGVPTDVLNLVGATDGDDMLEKARAIAAQLKQGEPRAAVPTVLGDSTHPDHMAAPKGAKADFIEFMSKL